MPTFAELHRMAVAQDHGGTDFRELPIEIQALGCNPVKMSRALLDWIAANIDSAGRERLAADVSRAFGY